MKTSETLSELATALGEAQAEMKPAPMTGRNPHLKNKYATLNDIIDTARGPLQRHGLSYIQMPTSPADLAYPVIGLRTRLMHKSGEWVEDEMFFPVDPGSNRAVNPAQVAGSTITYMRRYALAAMLGIVADEDADGNDAPPARQPQAQASTKPPTKRREYADGSPVAQEAAGFYDRYTAAHNGNAPDNVHNLRNWVKAQKTPQAQPANGELFPPEQPQVVGGGGAYQE